MIEKLLKIAIVAKIVGFFRRKRAPRSDES